MKPILISFGILALWLGAHLVQLPGVQPTGQHGGTLRMYNVMTLGITPFVTAFMLVEWVALLVPRWRPLRVGAPEDRARLKRVAVIIGLVLTLGQAVVLLVGLAGMGMIYPQERVAQLLAVMTLLIVAVVQLKLAQTVDRSGAGNGFAILLLGEMLLRALNPFFQASWLGQPGQASPPTFQTWILAAALPLAMAVCLFQSRSVSAKVGMHRASWISRPACGLAPLTIVLVCFDYSARIVTLLRNGGAGEAVQPTITGPLGARLALAIGAAFLFAWLFNHPGRIAKAWQRLVPNPPGGIPLLSIVFAECSVFIAVLTVAEFWMVNRFGTVGFDVVALLLATAILTDVIRESRVRVREPRMVSVWEVHQTYVVPPLLLCLENEGIRAFAQGQHFRGMMQFFGPYVPIRILVPADQAQKAEAILRERLSNSRGQSE